MKIELPLETWTELFGFVPRSQLIKLVPHIERKPKRNRRSRKCQQPIGDRQFVLFVQFFLHKCGQVSLGVMSICSSRHGPIPILTVNGKNRELPLADVPIPENIKNFESIVIRNFDESVIAFLQEFQRNSLLDNVNLYFSDSPEFLWQILTNFLPLFTNLNSIEVNTCCSFVMDQLQSEYSELALPMFTSARVLTADYNCRDSWFCDWLRIPREDGKPRVLILDGFKQHDRLFSLSHFIKHIKKDFLEANQAVSFFIKLEDFRDAASVVQFLILEKSQTREKLVIKGKAEGHDYVTISRYPMGTNEEEWIEAMSQNTNIHNRKIIFRPYS